MMSSFSRLFRDYKWEWWNIYEAEATRDFARIIERNTSSPPTLWRATFSVATWCTT